MGLFDFITKRSPVVQTLELKKAFDAARFGIAGVPAYPDTDRFSMMQWQRRNEVVFACIRKKCEAASDPELVVEKFAQGDWKSYDGHPLVALLEKPNPTDTWDTFLTAWIASEETTGDFYAEIVRDRFGVPIQLWPLDPSCVFPIPDAKGGIDHYEFRSGYSPIIRLETSDVIHRRRPDINTRYFGLAPLRVAIGSVDGDQAQTDYIRAFFHSDGIPAGLLKFKDRNMSKEEAESLQQRWMANYRRGGAKHKQVGVLDQNVEFEKIGSNIKDTESDSTRAQAETRICMVFGVPPALIGSFAGLKFATTNATMKTHLVDFWINTMSPMLKGMRVWLTWELLPEFESIDLIKQKRIRVNFDMTQVMAMQEDDNARHSRARDNFAAGMWTINEARDATGQEPLTEDYFIQPKNVDVVSELVRALIAAKEPAPPPAQLPPKPDPNADPNAEPQPPPKQLTDGSGKGLIIPRVESVKTFDYNGLTLGREPRESEKLLDLKGMADAYDGEKSRLARILLGIRDELITQATEELKQHSADTVYQLMLTPPATAAKKLRKEIEAAVRIGRDQVAKELSQGSGKNRTPAALDTKDKGQIGKWIETLVDLLISRTINEIQHRAADLFAALRTLGLSEDEITARLRQDLDEQSVKVFESFASQAGNAAINAGRDAEAEERKDEWNTVEYSAILDKNTCDPCEESDGKSSTDVTDLPEAPNPDCEGGAQCRCFHIYIFNEENA